MTRVALKGLLGRKTRSILTALAIVLGVAMISGTYILTDTIQNAFNNVLGTAYRNSSVVISGKEIVKGANNDPSVPVSLVAKVRALPDVADAAGGYLFNNVQLVDRKGHKISNGGAPTFGFGVDPHHSRFNPIDLVSGHWASGPHQIVIDTGVARTDHYRLGDTIKAKGSGPLGTFTIVGLGQITGVSIGGATLAVFDVPTARAVLQKTGLDVISVAARSGVSQDKLAAEIRRIAPSHVQVRTAAAQTRNDENAIADGTNTITYFLLAFGGIALFVGAFVIFNTISITVAQRTRELATLRTLGASRRQVRRSVLVESAAIGAAASVVGLFSGLALSRGLSALFKALGAGFPEAGTVFATRTIVVSLLVGTTVTVLAGLFPAIRATRIPAISAVREGAVPPRSPRASWRPSISAAVTLLGVAVIAGGLFGTNSAGSALSLLGLGTLLFFVGVALVSSYLVRPLAAVVGQPALRFGGAAGRLAAGNATRNTGRTAATAAALMIGIALVSFVATLGAGLRSSVSDALDKQVTADYVVTPSTSDSSATFSAAETNALTAVPAVKALAGIQTDRGRIFGSATGVAGIDPTAIVHSYRFSWKQGSNAVLRTLGNGAILDSEYAKAHHLHLGSTFTVESSTGATSTFVVKATYRAPQADPLLPNVVLSRSAFDRAFPQPQDKFAFVSVAGGASAATTAQLKHALAALPDLKVQTRAEWVTSEGKSVNRILDLFYVLLALSVIISLFGMVNTLVLAVFERTRELGMLRAIGMSRRQVRRMIRHESIITALIGAALGLPLGVFLAALVTRGLSSLGVSFHVPTTLVYFGVIALVAGILAAVFPARRAARLNVLEALQYE